MPDFKTPSAFFKTNYAALRVNPPMCWMVRLFEDVIAGKHPLLVDLETGAGKTELVAVWLLALAWFGLTGRKGSPVPRRLVWIVNRRVLVQQVFKIAKELREKTESDVAPELGDVRAGLRALCGSDDGVFQVVELRGQIVADRDWAIRPAMPQLIIGTVDQIGSRLLFQGYGLGKWGRPQQAGLLGVDSWVAVDEAHLVPAFVITLRQLRERCALAVEQLASPFDTLFAQLPFWLTELSATPGLPRPPKEKCFSLTDDEKADELMKDRVLASEQRRVLLRVFPAGKKATETKDALIQKIVEAAIASNAQRTAVFTREVTVADKVADGIRKKLKEQGIAEDHLCKITGRIRGYERECLSKQKAFRAFIEPRDVASTERWFLIGTAAAEVGLDADADAIFCDFAPLPTLLQRLGRLDRRGILSRRHVEGNGDAPTMVIFTTPEQTKADMHAKLTALAGALKAETKSYSAELMAGTHWSTADRTDKDKTDDDLKEQKPAKNPVKPLVEAATWSVLDPKEGVCKSPNEWLARDNARIAAGPVVVPPLTDAVLDYFSATTEPRSPSLSPHPFLYGLADDDERAPLVGVAFRLEVEALRNVLDDDDTEASDVAADVEEIFKRFPPLRAELHQMKLSAVRDWLTSDEGTKNPLVYRAKDKWDAKPAGESARTVAAAIGPNGTLILPSSVLMRDPCKELLEDCERSDGRDTATSDVLDGVSDPQQARYLRTIEPRDGLAGEDGAWRWDFDTQSQMRAKATKPDGFRQKLRKELRIGGKEYVFRYYRPHLDNGQLQYLDDFNGEAGHLTRAKNEAARLAKVIAPGNAFLSTLLTFAAHYHDEGKRFPKWQRAFGWRNGMRELAKLHPDSEKPAPLNGFRHEWESLRRLVEKGATSPANFSPEDQQLWSDLLLHLVGVHHGHLRPSITNDGLTPTTEPEKQNPLRLNAAERFAWLQSKLGRWRLAYLEALLKTADAEGSRVIPEEEEDGN